MFSGQRILPAIIRFDILDLTFITAFGVGRYQPWTFGMQSSGAGFSPDFVRFFSVAGCLNGQHSFQNIFSAKGFPFHVICFSTVIVIFQIPAAVATLAAVKLRHFSFKPDAVGAGFIILTRPGFCLKHLAANIRYNR